MKVRDTSRGRMYAVSSNPGCTVINGDMAVDVPAGGQAVILALDKKLIIDGDDAAKFVEVRWGTNAAVASRPAPSWIGDVVDGLVSIVGADKFDVNYFPIENKLYLQFSLEVTTAQIEEVKSLCARVLPSNVVLEMEWANGLPVEYNTYLEFLESNGVQYIKTGIIPDNLTGQHCEYYSAISTADHHIAGVNQNPSFMLPPIVRSNGGTFSSGYAWGAWDRMAVLTKTCRATSSLNFLNDRKAISTSELLSFEKPLAELPFTPTLQIYLFGANKANAHNNKFHGKIYSYKLSQGDKLILDYIPVLDQAGVPCMLDLVSSKPFYNQGTGSDFIAGMTMDQASYLANLPATGGSMTVSLPLEAAFDDKVQSALTAAADKGWTLTVQYRESELTTEHIEADFLESTGTQYINLGFIPNNESGIKCEHHTSSTEDLLLAGTRNGDSRWLAAIARGGKYRDGYGWNSWVPLAYVDGLYKSIGQVNFKNDRTARLEYPTGQVLTSQILDTIPQHTIPAYLFAYNFDGVANMRYKGKVFSAELTQGKDVVCSLIPTLDSTGTPCMHDTISGQNFYNQGSGSFIVGFDTTEKAAVSLSKLPFTTGGTLTVSLPAAAKDTATLVPAAIDIAKSRGWTIITQYRTN